MRGEGRGRVAGAQALDGRVNFGLSGSGDGEARAVEFEAGFGDRVADACGIYEANLVFHDSDDDGDGCVGE